ncbi:hypothetical protein SAMN02746041_00516 [Desulfacinum hydrothermale DSM 13146]|uniref:WG containing repeat-containing protein n=1 Tax=Desulfacinum hydrothermale DSM 13146 TaxID=1121390 RepID=A0A1W1X4J7_9BACT|nr:hypothetical protein [Desulfacinum hydrothermale]SMC18743.1 hypothetical protein SAMN02746041_00516 [Desulfacinum hydrothermale DSM 13146]
MKKTLFFVTAGLLLIPSLCRANVFELFASHKEPGAFYFTPAATSKECALFGYMSKITPTAQEIDEEKRRIHAIIDEAVRNGYGNWGNFEKAMRDAGEQSGQDVRKEAPPWVRSLTPSSLIKEAVPFLMKGSLSYAKAHAEATRDPVGSVGETGVIMVDPWGGVAKVPLGMNAPVVSIDISPSGWMAAVLTDMSFEDENGRLHPLGEISLIDLRSKTRTYSWIFANLAERVAFVPGANMLAFDCYADMNDLSKREVRFIHLKNRQVTKHHFRLTASGSGLIFGKKVRYPNFIPAPTEPIVAFYTQGMFDLCDILTGQTLLKLTTNSHVLAFAHRHPWVFTGIGELWDFKAKKRLGTIKPRLGRTLLSLGQARFTRNDRYVFYLEGRILTRFDTERARSTMSTGESRSRAGLFFLTPDDRFIVAFVPGKGMVTYKQNYLRRQRLCLRIIASDTLRAQQDICPKGSTVVDAAMAGNTLIVSDFDHLYVYANAASMAAPEPDHGEPHSSLLEKIERNPGQFANKIIQLDGWAWGWMAQPPASLKGRSPRFARNNYGSRMDGTFTDGIVRIRYPIPVKYSGPFHLKARVAITPAGWQLVPVD